MRMQLKEILQSEWGTTTTDNKNRVDCILACAHVPRESGSTISYAVHNCALAMLKLQDHFLPAH